MTSTLAIAAPGNRIYPKSADEVSWSPWWLTKWSVRPDFPALRHIELTSAFHMYAGKQSAEGCVQKWRR